MPLLSAFSFALLITASSLVQLASADPDITSDFILPANATSVDGGFFTFTGLRQLRSTSLSANIAVFQVSAGVFPALNGQSVSMAVLEYPAGSADPPHTHPRSAELLFLLEGYLEVGFVDTANEIYRQTLQPGDVFVFPKGLPHYQFCSNGSVAFAISAFGSANAGTVWIPQSLFASGIDEDVRATSSLGRMLVIVAGVFWVTGCL